MIIVRGLNVFLHTELRGSSNNLRECRLSISVWQTNYCSDAPFIGSQKLVRIMRLAQ